MKLPSIQQVYREASRTFARFPLVLIDAVIVTVIALIIVDYEGPPTSSILFKILFASILGFPLLLASTLVGERRAWTRSKAMAIQGGCVLLLVAYAMSVPSNIAAGPMLHVIRLLMLALGFCLLVITAPFVGSGQLNGFWHYGKSLLQRILLTALFSATLFVGLMLALVSIDALFGVDVPGKRYGELWLIIVGIFASWFFLAGVPRELGALESRTDYPRVLRVFGQYILSPMLIVYFVILYAYVAKITIEWSWPKGMVSGTIFGFASIGIAAYLLLYPMRDRSEYGWIKGAMRWFWIVMIPMIVVLNLAIWRRVSEYGITENRYFAFALGVWLAAMALYFLVSKRKNITVIPASVSVIALLASFGPWSAFSVSEQSQVGRLEQLLLSNQLLVDGIAQKADGQVSPEDVGQISSIMWYLHETHGYEKIQPWFAESLKLDSAGLGSVDKGPATVVELLGIEFNRYPYLRGEDYGELRANLERAVSIEGYDHLLVVQRLSADMSEFGYPHDDVECSIDSNLDVMTLRVLEGKATIDSVQISLRPFVDSLLEHHRSIVGSNIPPGKMSVETATETMKLKIVLRRIEFRRDGDQVTPTAYEAITLYSQAEPSTE